MQERMNYINNPETLSFDNEDSWIAIHESVTVGIVKRWHKTVCATFTDNCLSGFDSAAHQKAGWIWALVWRTHHATSFTLFSTPSNTGACSHGVWIPAHLYVQLKGLRFNGSQLHSAQWVDTGNLKSAWSLLLDQESCVYKCECAKMRELERERGRQEKSKRKRDMPRQPTSCFFFNHSFVPVTIKFEILVQLCLGFCLSSPLLLTNDCKGILSPIEAA